MKNSQHRSLTRNRRAGHFWPLALALFSLSCSTSTGVDYSFWEANLVPVGGNAESGVAAAVTQFGRTDASVEIRQGVASSFYGWYLKNGGCQQDGTILGGIANYPLIPTDESGIGNSSAVISVVLRPGSTYAVRLYVPLESGGEEVVACGILQETGDEG